MEPTDDGEGGAASGVDLTVHRGLVQEERRAECEIRRLRMGFRVQPTRVQHGGRPDSLTPPLDLRSDREISCVHLYPAKCECFVC